MFVPAVAASPGNERHIPLPREVSVSVWPVAAVAVQFCEARSSQFDCCALTHPPRRGGARSSCSGSGTWLRRFACPLAEATITKFAGAAPLPVARRREQFRLKVNFR